MKPLAVMVIFFLSFGYGFAQDSTDRQDSLLPYKPYRMHSFGVHVRSKYAYLLEYNFRTWPHVELKLEGGTADHNHFNLSGFSTTTTSGRYAGVGLSLLSSNYFKPRKSYHIQRSILASAGYGIGRMNFHGEQTIESTYFKDRNYSHTQNNIDYTYLELRLGFEVIVDRVIRFDVYPVQFTFYEFKSAVDLPYRYIPATGLMKYGNFNPGLGIHANINQLKRKKEK